MHQLRDFGDERQTALCAYCAGPTETRDHVPSRILLDRPYPPNLPVVSACDACNKSFSADEEYVACLIDCVVSGTTALEAPKRRPQIRRILAARPALAARLESARFGTGAATRFDLEQERVHAVVLKLARGHALFELGCPQHEAPSMVSISPIRDLDAASCERFEHPPEAFLLPEVGSRGMQRMVESRAPDWIEVQPNRYRFLAYVAHAVTVRVVLSEYLACEVAWSDVWQAPRPDPQDDMAPASLCAGSTPQAE